MTRYDNWKNTVPGSQLLLGLVLLVMPWAAGFAAEQMAAWTAWITGAAIAVFAIVAMVGYATAGTWANLVLGAWAIAAPWLLGFAAIASAMWSHVAIGALVALSAAAGLWSEHQSSPRVHA